MIEVTGRPRIRSGSTRAEPAVIGFLRSLDWILMAAAAGARRLRALGRLGDHALRRPGDEGYFVVRQGFAAAVGAVGLVRWR